MFVLVTYDIENDKLRGRVADALERYGRRVQYSVFECNLSAPRYETMKQQLDTLVTGFEPGEDAQQGAYSIRYYRLCKACVDRFEILGQGHISTDEAFYMV